MTFQFYRVIFLLSGATEDAINQAREEFHAYLAANKKTQAQQPDYTDEELMMEEREFEQEFSGMCSLLLSSRTVINFGHVKICVNP